MPQPPILPPVFLFRLAFPCHYVKALPRSRGALLKLADQHVLPAVGASPEAPGFARIATAWNERGLGLAFEVRGKQRPPEGNPEQFDAGDSVQVWIDTRDTRTIHRASGFCHHFYFVPTPAVPLSVTAGQVPIHRARQDAPLSPPGEIRAGMIAHPDGYTLEVFLTAAVLHGFDPGQNRRLGFFSLIRDQELGDQYLTVGRDFPVSEDPSLWVTLALVD